MIFVCLYACVYVIFLSIFWIDGTRAARDGPEEEEHKLEYDEDICDITEGKWVFNRSIKPLYTDQSCPYLDKQVSCVKNGRPDSDYRYWHWQPDECFLPRCTHYYLKYNVLA